MNTAKQSKRLRLSPEEREKQIVQEAIRFFAEVGFDGQTRELAKRLGVTQPLLYRYFPTKQDLIDRVYEEVYLTRWKPIWEDWIKDRTQPLPDRLKRFYHEYYPVIVNYEWMRIFFQAGMRNVGFNRRYLKLVREHIFLPLCAEMRHEFGLPGIDKLQVGDAELELYWGLHGSIIYDGIRKYIYGLDVPPDVEPTIDAKIDTFIGGLKPILQQVLASAG
ncbi:TetR/AcrR family transcriptional regulator [Ferrovibrio sp.]|uniref:TetR/AcrR family transcriptional regulator n=1 Tax=Ferrovibrio sp. TaxID=1917215 RepID=UPI001B52D392|nr:TetR/AcrR family transcriptional regulator [Ferrovibrio sp.]MBP7063835.1 TetR/AcrR family transcriptional regulator [Ferrovibrio sp.]